MNFISNVKKITASVGPLAGDRGTKRLQQILYLNYSIGIHDYARIMEVFYEI